MEAYRVNGPINYRFTSDDLRDGPCFTQISGMLMMRYALAIDVWIRETLEKYLTKEELALPVQQLAALLIEKKIMLLRIESSDHSFEPFHVIQVDHNTVYTFELTVKDLMQ